MGYPLELKAVGASLLHKSDRGGVLVNIEDTAGLEKGWHEPIDPNDPLFRYNVIASPHIAGVTDLSLDSIAREVAENVNRLPLGDPLKYIVAWHVA